MIPVKISVTIQDEHSRLPGMEHGILKVDGSEYPLCQPDTTIEISALPGYYRLRSIPMSFHADRFYIDLEEPLRIGKGISQHITLRLRRDSTFAVFAGTIYDGVFENFDSHPIEGAKITVGKYESVSDANGHFRIDIPLEEQEEVKPIMINKQGYQLYQREDESPNKELRYMLHH